LPPKQRPQLVEDMAHLQRCHHASDLPTIVRPGPSYIVAFTGRRREPLVIDGLTSHFLKLSDGTHIVVEITNALSRQGDFSATIDLLGWTENMFIQELIALQDRPNAEHGISLSNPADASAVADVGPV
jgi:hypothetical protein